MTREAREAFIERNHVHISLARQSELLGISRSSLYYTPIDPIGDKLIMDALDELFTKYPILGSRKLPRVLKDLYNISAGRDRIRRLKRLMGLHTIYQKPNLSKPRPQSLIYPYLLNNFQIIRPNQVWATDITYIRLQSGWAYLIAILDWFSRYVLSWRLSKNLELPFCLEALDDALLHHDAPEIFNSDQGSHFTATEWIARLKAKTIRISMDGRGRCMDNIFTERLWRTVKWDNVYLKGYTTYDEANAGLKEFFVFYNMIRPHQSLGQKTPHEIHFVSQIPEKRRATIAQERSLGLEMIHGSSSIPDFSELQTQRSTTAGVR